MKHPNHWKEQILVPLTELDLPEATGEPLTSVRLEFYSKHLKTHLRIDVFLPLDYQTETDWSYPLLIANDGGEMTDIALPQTTADLVRSGEVHPIIIAAIHSTRERKHIYGVANEPDYANRGDKAGLYSLFVLEELLPWLKERFRIIDKPEALGIMGFSLGGLMAFDLAWSNPDVFKRVGVFSGSFWWRAKSYDNGYTDTDRIMISKVTNTKTHPSDLQCWFQTGTLDETNDRDKDGVIDSIGDALDLLSELTKKGFPKDNLTYVEIEGGHHNQATWKMAYPLFMKTLFHPKV
jgi:enterochelin esterase-like enzyme